MIDITKVLESEFDCTHEDTRIVKHIMANNAVMVIRQCCRCGRSIGGAMPQKGLDLDALPLRDDALLREWHDKQQARREQLRILHYGDNEDTWWERVYQPYMRSENWYALRRRVIYRDNFACQDCFSRITESTAHVHHTSYKGLKETGESFAFECVTLCPRCHHRVHPHMNGGAR
jgi:hypothetical protein